jgi:glucose-1-phosphate thymidylyltransferase
MSQRAQAGTPSRGQNQTFHSFIIKLTTVIPNPKRGDNTSVKGLLLSGGKGTRLRPLTHTRAKQLIPVAGKPILHYCLEDLVSSGIQEVGVVVGETASEVRASLGNGSAFGASITYIYQEAPLGIAHAVKIAREFLADDPFVLYLGDNLLSGGIESFVQAFRESGPAASILLSEVTDPRAFGVVEVNENGQAIRLVEKPQNPSSNLALVGVYLFSAAVHPVIAGLKPSGRGELEITEAIQGLVDHGLTVDTARVRGWWKDTGRPEDLLEANRLVLAKMVGEVRGQVEQSQLQGEVTIAAGAVVKASTLRGPVYVGAGARVERAYLGPYTSVGSKAVVTESEVEYSILLDGARVTQVGPRLDGSILGEDAVVSGQERELPRGIRVVLGDRSRVDL